MGPALSLSLLAHTDAAAALDSTDTPGLRHYRRRSYEKIDTEVVVDLAPLELRGIVSNDRQPGLRVGAYRTSSAVAAPDA